MIRFSINDLSSKRQKKIGKLQGQTWLRNGTDSKHNREVLFDDKFIAFEQDRFFLYKENIG